MFLEEGFGIFTPLPQPHTVIGEPGAGFFDNACLDTEIDQFAILGDTLAVHDVKFHLLERWRHLVFNDFDAGRVADYLFLVLDRSDTANIKTHRSIKFKGIATRCGFRRSIHHTDFHADLVDEDHHAVGARDRGRQLAQGLRHQTRLQTRLHIAHFAFDFRARNEGCHRVDDENINRAGAHQRIGNFQPLLSCIGLRDQQVLEIDPKLFGIDRIERMLGIDKAADAALLLGLGDRVQSQCCFA